MKLFNTLTRQKEEFKPINPSQVGMYCCGPTVYHYAHIGNLRTYIFEDLLRRALEFNEYKVKHVMNITDVGHLTSDEDDGEDKMLKGAKREKKTPKEIAEFYEQAFLDDMKSLNLEIPEITPRATEHVSDMIDQIKQLEENGYTYVGQSGNVYFDTKKFKNYGELAQLDKQKLQACPRVEVDPNKKDSHDFVLWFVSSKHGDQEMQWDSPWGRGFPGWHIECSAMSCKYLGEQFDIHCGGIDHIPVHHTNEIAQAEGATGKHRWVNYWMHGNFLVLKDKTKMAKSDDNFLTLQLLIDKGYSPLDYRYFCLQSHYRKELAFDWDGLDAAKTGLRRLKDKVKSFGEDSGEINSSYFDRFKDVISDDLNIPQALALAWDLVDDKNLSDKDKLSTIKIFDEVLGLKLDEKVEFSIPDEVQKLVEERDIARSNKDFEASDKLRNEIQNLGWIVKDGNEGTEVIPK